MLRHLGCLLLLLGLAGCGFQPRGVANIPFSPIYLFGYENSVLSASIARQLTANGVKMTAVPAEAQAGVQLMVETREKRILSLNAAGRVREFQLIYRVVFRVIDPQLQEILPPTTIDLKRDISFSDSEVLGKEQEENLLYRDMQADAVQQVMRRLAAIKPRQ